MVGPVGIEPTTLGLKVPSRGPGVIGRIAKRPYKHWRYCLQQFASFRVVFGSPAAQSRPKPVLTRR
jgi:hypothetical protein